MDQGKNQSVKVPVVRQTKTSVYRYARANPHLIQGQEIRVFNKPVLLPISVICPGLDRRQTLDVEIARIQQPAKAQSDVLPKMSYEALEVQLQEMKLNRPSYREQLLLQRKKKLQMQMKKANLNKATSEKCLTENKENKQQQLNDHGFKKPSLQIKTRPIENGITPLRRASSEVLNISTFTTFENYNMFASTPASMAGNKPLVDLKEHPKKVPRQECDVHNVFESTIIKMAIEEKHLDKSDVDENKENVPRKFVGTPVKRSTRKSCAKYRTTPGKTLYHSINHLDSTIKMSLEIKTNRYLQY